MKYPKIYIKEILKSNAGLLHWLVFAKDYFRWKRFLPPYQTPVGNAMPWVTFEAIRFMEKHLHRTMKVFEYGSGGSTLFLCKRVEEVISVEHDKRWFDTLREKIKTENIKKWKGFLIEPKFVGETGTSNADAMQYRSSAQEFLKYDFKTYCSYVDNYPYESFDWILVDGRARPSCLKHAIPKLKQGGYLLLDNSNREYYLENLPIDFDQRFKIVCDQSGPAPFLLEFSKTTIWRKIK